MAFLKFNNFQFYDQRPQHLLQDLSYVILTTVKQFENHKFKHF